MITHYDNYISDTSKAPAAVKSSKKHVKLPEHVPYLIVGGGTASFAAFRAIRGGDADAKVEFISVR